MAEVRHGSILAVDFGSVNTRVLLLDIVDGEYRLVARGGTSTTVGYPLDDVGVGLARILQDTSTATGRTFFDKEGRLIMPETADRAGIDYFVTTASAGRPMRAVLVGLMPDISLNSAIRAMNDVYIEPVAMLHLLDGMGEEGRMNAILLSRPDLILVAGGTEGGATSALLDILKPVELAVRLTDPAKRPNVIYAGNSEIAEKVKKLFGDLTGLFIAGNVRPLMEEEDLDSAIAELGRAYDVHKERHGAGFNEIGELSQTGVLPTAGSYTLITEYFAKTRKANVITVDIGSSTTVLVSVFGGFLDTTVSTTLGVGHSSSTLVEQVGLEKLAEWLPFYVRRSELKNYALNKALRPAGVPLSLRDLYIEHAMVRAGIQHAIETSRPGWKEVDKVGPLPQVDLILAAGSSLTGTGTPAYNMMLAVDAIRPTGITDVKADPHGLLPALGALARVNAPAAVQLLESSYLEHLGTVISITGIPTPEKTAITLKLKGEDGQTGKVEIPGGHMLLWEVPPGFTIEFEMTVARGLSINGKRRIKRKFTGGTAGLLFDARGRPLNTGLTVAERAARLPMWVHEATDNPLLEVPGDWLIEPAAEVEEDEAESAAEGTAAAAPRRGLFGFFRRSTQPAKSVQQKEDDDALDSLMSQLESEDKVRRTTEQPGLPKKGLTGKLKLPEAGDDDDLDSLRNL